MPPVLGSTVSLSKPYSVSKRWTCSSTGCANVTWHDSPLLYWPSVVLVAAHAPAAAKLEEHTQLVMGSNTHGPVAETGDKNGDEGGDEADEGGEEGSGDSEEFPLSLSPDRASPGNGICGGGGMPTTAKNSGSHCSG